MRQVYQTIIDNVRGDCERACVATIMGLCIEDVPNFVDPDERAWLREWVHTKGWGIIELKQNAGPDGYVYTGLYGLVAIASVPSQMFPDECTHAVVVGWRPHPDHERALECYVIHDPNPHNEPYEDVGEVVTRLRWLVPHAQE